MPLAPEGWRYTSSCAPSNTKGQLLYLHLDENTPAPVRRRGVGILRRLGRAPNHNEATLRTAWRRSFFVFKGLNLLHSFCFLFVFLKILNHSIIKSSNPSSAMSSKNS